jgi:hypothetical protein
MAMELKIDLDKLRKLKLNIPEYSYLFIRYHNLVITYYFNNPSNNIDFKYLENEGYIKETEEGIFLRQKAIDLFIESTPDTKFYEFYSNYPFKVSNGKGGYRVIRSKDINSKQATDLKVKYLKLIKTPGLHEKIMKGLFNYMESLKPTMQYIVGVEVFINQLIFERYCDLDDVDNKTNEISI